MFSVIYIGINRRLGGHCFDHSRAGAPAPFTGTTAISLVVAALQPYGENRLIDLGRRPCEIAKGSRHRTPTIHALDGTTPEPHLFWSADMNYDNILNILDVVRIVNFILN